MEHVRDEHGFRVILCKHLELVKSLLVESTWTVIDGGDDAVNRICLFSLSH